ncbi:uncharacterized protein GGS22DRAFT_184871 [Annulohypoxylon maeteangense]|uniref:uncharacterized protein n=1 Tax=Annulohypoxylon maeteangense TaxID=1927788 RepID=UPI002007284A|nr:uncharacterized protein GGS22DRAFT_184871 [Annulohypoxylon maeteangense]KAI0889293.1 hypothetical protein GGS22DRAFT_184871 [Annulohypoxylon maeteangense]
MDKSSMTEDDHCEIKWSECYRKWKTQRTADFTKSSKLLQQTWASSKSDSRRRLITFQSALMFMAYFWTSIRDHGNVPGNNARGNSINNLVEVADTRVLSSTHPISGNLIAVMMAVSLKQGVQMNSEMMAVLKSSFQNLLDLWMNGEKCDAILFTMPQVVHFKYGGLHSTEEMVVRFGTEDFVLAAQAQRNDGNAGIFQGRD